MTQYVLVIPSGIDLDITISEDGKIANIAIPPGNKSYWEIRDPWMNIGGGSLPYVNVRIIDVTTKHLHAFLAGSPPGRFPAYLIGKGGQSFHAYLKSSGGPKFAAFVKGKGGPGLHAFMNAKGGSHVHAFLNSKGGSRVPAYSFGKGGNTFRAFAKGIGGRFFHAYIPCPAINNFGKVRSNTFIIDDTDVEFGITNPFINYRDSHFAPSTHLNDQVELIHSNYYSGGNMQPGPVLSCDGYIYMNKHASYGDGSALIMVEYNVKTGEKKEITVWASDQSENAQMGIGWSMMSLVTNRVLFVSDNWAADDSEGTWKQKLFIVDFDAGSSTCVLEQEADEGGAWWDDDGWFHYYKYNHYFDNLIAFTDDDWVLHLVAMFQYRDISTLPDYISIGYEFFHATYIPQSGFTIYRSIQNWDSHGWWANTTQHHVLVNNRYVAVPGVWVDEPGIYIGYCSYNFDAVSKNIVQWRGGDSGLGEYAGWSQMTEGADGNAYAQLRMWEMPKKLIKLNPQSGLISEYCTSDDYLMARRDSAFKWGDGIKKLPSDSPYSERQKPSWVGDAGRIIDDNGNYWYLDGTKLICEDKDMNKVKEIETGINGTYRSIQSMGTVIVITSMNAARTQVDYYIVK